MDHTVGSKGAEISGEDLREAWDRHAAQWVRWARTPGHDSYWRFARAAFFPMLPAPGRLTLDLGCGEGRVSRDLVAAGHRVVAMDGAAGMARAARQASPELPLLIADGSRLPLRDGVCDLVVAYMTLHDFDDMPRGVAEASRVLERGGRLCAGVVHPINSAGNFEDAEDDAAFVIEQSYFEERGYVDRIERDGLEMTFSSRHHSLQDYFEALSAAGLSVDALREVPGDTVRWQRLPMFLFFRAVK